MTKTYREDTAAVVEALEETLRVHFKTEDVPPIPFEYRNRTYDIRDRETRMLVVAAVQDAYYHAHGEFNQRRLDEWYAKSGQSQRPSPVPLDATLLDRLTDVILYEEITDPNPHKVAHTEYPFFSMRQLDLRRDREASDTAAATHGTDGKDYRPPGRRVRTAYDNAKVDAVAKIRNKKRALQYRKDTAAGAVVSYNLHDTGGALADEFTDCSGIGQRWADEMGEINEIILVREVLAGGDRGRI